jgi:predicted dehydrogenase
MILRWGIIGCGDVAERKGGPALYGVTDSELVAVMRRDAAKAADFARRHDAKRWYQRVEDLVNDPEVNAVYVATPVYLHRAHTIQAAQAGKHVLCEKPMAMDVQECQDMVDVCRENRVKLMVAYYRRTYPIVQRMRTLLAQDVIGRPMLVRINLTGHYGLTDPDAPLPWRVDPLMGGGGVLFDVGSHRLDVLHYLLGPVRQVSAFVETLRASYPVEDSVVLSAKLANGMHGVANFNWNIGSSTDDFEIYGTEGKMTARSLEVGHLEVYRGAELVEAYDQPRHEITHWGLVENMVQAVNEDVPLICTGEDGLLTNQLMAAIYRSAEEKRVMSVR